jgi:hypothetical protein
LQGQTDLNVQHVLLRPQWLLHALFFEDQGIVLHVAATAPYNRSSKALALLISEDTLAFPVHATKKLLARCCCFECNPFEGFQQDSILLVRQEVPGLCF